MRNVNSLVVDALVDNRKYTQAFTWSIGINKVLSMINKVDIWHRPILVSASRITDVVKFGLQNVYNIMWTNVIKSTQGKLRTYALFKDDFVLENYVVLLNRPSRSAFCKLRVSAHKLMIERGRYCSPKIPVEDRICKLCDSNEVEDEFHFIMNCKMYIEHRDILMIELGKIVNINNLNRSDIFQLIMCASDYDILRIVTSYVVAAFDKHSLPGS